MPELGPVDLVVTSPPYNMGITSGGGLKGDGTGSKWKAASRCGGLAQGYKEFKDAMPWPKYEKWQKEFISLAYSILSETGAIYYNHKPRPWNGEIRLPTIYNPGLPLRQVIIWRRNGGINFSQTHYVPSCEWILIICKKGFRLKNKRCSGEFDVWNINSIKSDDHPCPFPVELPLKILNTVNSGLTLDPYMGRGTTAIACERLNRKWIGIEISEEYCEITAKRIEKETQQLKLFN